MAKEFKEVSVAAAVASCKTLAKQYKGVLEISEVLTEINNLQDYKTSLENSIKENKEASIKARDDLDKAKGQVDKAKAMAIRIVSDAHDDKNEILKQNQAVVDKLFDDFNVEKNKFNQSVEATKAERHQAAVNHEENMKKWTKEEKELQGDLKALYEEMEVLKKRFG